MRSLATRKLRLVAPLLTGMMAVATVGVSANPSQAAERVEGRLSQIASKVDAAGFTAELSGSGSYVTGKEGALTVTLMPKGDFKVNQQFPIKFKLGDAPEGISYPKAVLKKEEAKLSEKSATFSVPFVASKAGRYKIKGTLSLSVCNDAKCLMEKVDLEQEVDVK